MIIEKLPVGLLKPYENNAKLHPQEQIDQIAASIREFGFNDPIAVDENNMVIEGHGRLLACEQLGIKEVEVIRLSGLTSDQKRAYIHVHNQLTMNTGFDMALLEQELQSITTIDMSIYGFDLDFDIDMHPEDLDKGEKPTDTEAHTEKRVKRGEIWQLGNHRLMCGDSTDELDVDMLTEGAEMDLCVTDPPYNVNYEGQNGMTIENDNLEDSRFHAFLFDFYTQMLRALKPGGGFYIFHADSEGLNFRSALVEAGGQIRQNLIWVKNSLNIGRQDYQWKHEPCLYGWKDGASHYFTKDRCQTTVFENRPDLESMDREQLLKTAQFLLSAIDQMNTTIIHENKPQRSELHPTMKPIPLVQRLIQNSSRRNEKVLDLFGGSGTTLIACENCGRRAYIMELDPKYCDAILSRWEEHTGSKAVKIYG